MKVNWYSYGSDRGKFAGFVNYQYELHKIIKRHEPEVIIGASDSLHVISAALLGRRYGLPYVVDLYDNFESFGLTRLPFVRYTFRTAVKHAGAVSVISDELAAYVRKKYRPRSGVTVIENAVPGDVFFPIDKGEARSTLNLPQAGVFIGTAGALDATRGIDTLYRAFLSLVDRYDGLHLVLAGRKDVHSPVPQHERVHYLGEIDYEQVPLFLNSLDIGVICNRPDAFGSYCFPQKLYEMLACKIPVIATNVGVMKRLFCHFPRNLFEPDDSQGLAGVIISQMNAPVFPDFPIPTWTEKAQKLDKLIRQVVTS
jgi:glycosyltransferase involved in cell wall biosynthesis